MATVKRSLGDFVITTLAANNNVEINTNTVKIANALQVGDLTATGNVSLPGAGSIVVGNITANNLSLGNNITMGGGITSNGGISAAGNVTGAVFIGDGSGLTGVPAGNALGNIISFGTSRVAIPLLSGNVYVNVGGISNVAVFTTGGANIGGNIAANAYYWSNGVPFAPGGSVTYDAFPVAPGNANIGDFWFNTTNGVLYQYNDDGDSNQWVDSSGVASPPAVVAATANTIAQRDNNASLTANVYIGNGVVVTGNIQSTSGYLIGNGAFLTGIVTSAENSNISNGTSSVSIATAGGPIVARVNGSSILSVSSDGITNLNGNGVGNIGNSTGYFNRIFATSTSALYADLAENYISDDFYGPGTVVVFGGEHEITTSDLTHDTRAAGVISDKPSYLMNAGEEGLPVALTGKVKCYVRGPVAKGTLLTTSNQKGVAEQIKSALYRPGCVVGKSLEIIEDDSVRLISIAVGRY